MSNRTNADISAAKQARILFRNYRRIKMEIRQLSESIDFLSINMEQSIDSDIYTVSISHGTGMTGGGSARDRLPKIAEMVDCLRRDYSENILLMKIKKNVFERAAASMEIFTDSLEWSDKTILRRRFLDDNSKSLEEISNEVHLTVSAVKKRIVRLMQRYAESAHFDLSAALKEF